MPQGSILSKKVPPLLGIFIIVLEVVVILFGTALLYERLINEFTVSKTAVKNNNSNVNTTINVANTNTANQNTNASANANSVTNANAVTNENTNNSNLSVYTNLKYHYIVSLPSGWRANTDEFCSMDNVGFGQDGPGEKYQCPPDGGGWTYNISATSYYPTVAKAQEEIVSKNPGAKIVDDTISGKSAKHYLYTFSSEYLGGTFTLEGYLLSNESIVFDIRTQLDGSVSEYDSVFDQFAKSFIFTDQAGGWKTFSGAFQDGLAFSFRYPPELKVDIPTNEETQRLLSTVELLWPKGQDGQENGIYLINEEEDSTVSKEGIENLVVLSCSADGVCGSTLCEAPSASAILIMRTSSNLQYSLFNTTWKNEYSGAPDCPPKNKSESLQAGPFAYFKHEKTGSYLTFAPMRALQDFPKVAGMDVETLVKEILTTVKLSP